MIGNELHFLMVSNFRIVRRLPPTHLEQIHSNNNKTITYDVKTNYD